MKTEERVRIRAGIILGTESVQVRAGGKWLMVNPSASYAGEISEVINTAITEAVAAERERCAKVASDFAHDMRRQANDIDEDAGEGEGDNCREHAEAGDRIAAQIRAGGG